MISETVLQAYFNTHLLCEELNGFSTAEKQAALNAADLDVAAELGRPVTDEDDALLRAALAEQTIHLLLHRDALSGVPDRRIVSESIDGVGSCTYKVAENVSSSTLGSRARALLAGATLSGALQIKRG
ncbi:MAG: hypothetical protein MJ016_00105 [Victivallaceae bacterium]|nr:hypothetical protein [Victivallaceae bacterium]